MKCPLITFSCFPTETLALYWFLGKQLFIFFNNVPLSVICVSNICPTLCVFSGFTNVLHFKAVKFISLFRLLVFCDSRNPSLRKVKNILIHIPYIKGQSYLSSYFKTVLAPLLKHCLICMC